NELVYVINKYSSSKAFLRINGKPVIFIYAIGAYGRTIDFWGDTREYVEKYKNIKLPKLGSQLMRYVNKKAY
ncbi:MAG: hypothetical protein J7J99_09045, partial [Thermoprotei archaeon]|nr:hypothetical protein [Thermoprotei archaeon]